MPLLLDLPMSVWFYIPILVHVLQNRWTVHPILLWLCIMPLQVATLQFGDFYDMQYVKMYTIFMVQLQVCSQQSSVTYFITPLVWALFKLLPLSLLIHASSFNFLLLWHAQLLLMFRLFCRLEQISLMLMQMVPVKNRYRFSIYMNTVTTLIFFNVGFSIM